MSGSIRRTIAPVAGALALLGACGATTAAAASPAESATADFMSGPFHVQFSAQRAANAPATAATGTFVAHAGGFATLQGPVTCLDVRANRMGLFYPVTSSSPATIMSVIHGVFIYVTVSKVTGKPLEVGFRPTTAATASSCAPSLTLFPITSGTVTLTS
jgi:hypothetical protein